MNDAKASYLHQPVTRLDILEWVTWLVVFGSFGRFLKSFLFKRG